MTSSMKEIELKVNFGLVLRGDILALHEVTEGIDLLISEHPEVRLVHRHLSASKLWIKEGDDMNGTGRTLP